MFFIICDVIQLKNVTSTCIVCWRLEFNLKVTALTREPTQFYQSEAEVDTLHIERLWCEVGDNIPRYGNQK